MQISADSSYLVTLTLTLDRVNTKLIGFIPVITVLRTTTVPSFKNHWLWMSQSQTPAQSHKRVTQRLRRNLRISELTGGLK